MAKNEVSPTKGVGMGYHKEFIGRKKNTKQYHRHKSVFLCPECGENWEDNLIARRWCWLECRTCGYENDTMYWYHNVAKAQ